MDVFNGVSVEDFSDEIKEQIVHKGYSGIYICIARDGAFSPSVSQKQSTAYYEGGSDGQKYANDIINKAINEHFNELDIVDRFARAKEKLGKGEF